MEVKIRYIFANGHKERALKSYREANANLTPQQAVTAWTDMKFGKWIRENLGDRFTLENVNANGFDVDFQVDTHAYEFVVKIGGRVIE